MTPKSDLPGPFTLRRWSRRKLEAAREHADAGLAAPRPAQSPANDVQAGSSAGRGLSRTLETPAAISPAGVELPPIDSLTIDSDFTPFFQPQVDETVKRAALKQLFRDPRFNVMDGLDTYIDDYTLPDPVPAAMLRDLMQRRVSFAQSMDGTESIERDIDEPMIAEQPTAEAVAPPPLPGPTVSVGEASASASDPSMPATDSSPWREQHAAEIDADTEAGQP